MLPSPRIPFKARISFRVCSPLTISPPPAPGMRKVRKRWVEGWAESETSGCALRGRRSRWRPWANITVPRGELENLIGTSIIHPCEPRSYGRSSVASSLRSFRGGKFNSNYKRPGLTPLHRGRASSCCQPGYTWPFPRPRFPLFRDIRDAAWERCSYETWTIPAECVASEFAGISGEF